VFVFPSRTDTFGIVLLEALASGLPVAAFPVPGPLDVIGGTDAGVLDQDLAKACRAALAIAPETARSLALRYSWRASAEQFLANVDRTRHEEAPGGAPAVRHSAEARTNPRRDGVSGVRSRALPRTR
jgi:glycosyltransferase involved in cell wall biosynthesis